MVWLSKFNPHSGTHLDFFSLLQLHIIKSYPDMFDSYNMFEYNVLQFQDLWLFHSERQQKSFRSIVFVQYFAVFCLDSRILISNGRQDLRPLFNEIHQYNGRALFYTCRAMDVH